MIANFNSIPHILPLFFLISFVRRYNEWQSMINELSWKMILSCPLRDGNLSNKLGILNMEMCDQWTERKKSIRELVYMAMGQRERNKEPKTELYICCWNGFPNRNDRQEPKNENIFTHMRPVFKRNKNKIHTGVLFLPNEAPLCALLLPENKKITIFPRTLFTFLFVCSVVSFLCFVLNRWCPRHKRFQTATTYC